MVRFDTLSIVVPVYDEARAIHLILDELRQFELVHGIGRELILVDDCLTNDSAAVMHACAESKKIGWRDGFRAIYCIPKYGLLGQ